MFNLQFYLPLQQVEDGWAVFAPAGVGPVPPDLQKYPTIVVSPDPSNEERLIAVSDKESRPGSAPQKSGKRTGRGNASAQLNKSGKSGASIGSAEPNGANETHSPGDDSENDTYAGDNNSKNSRALQEAQAVARRLITLTKDTDEGFPQSETQTQIEKQRVGILITDNSAVYIQQPEFTNSKTKPAHVYGPMLSQIFNI